MFWTIIGILITLWLIGFVLNIIGGLIHILLIIAIFVFVFRLGQRFGKR
ncbi:lmo0937 family membrane protein [Salirhabdus sp. Marseille-P4669]|nr:lmo0937 family membrane protein [Salirhabdus sp. Marseille-P4669]